METSSQCERRLSEKHEWCSHIFTRGFQRRPNAKINCIAHSTIFRINWLALTMKYARKHCDWMLNAMNRFWHCNERRSNCCNIPSFNAKHRHTVRGLGMKCLISVIINSNYNKTTPPSHSQWHLFPSWWCIKCSISRIVWIQQLQLGDGKVNGLNCLYSQV